ncbi:MAG: transglutaminase domain-containing protein [Myxococcota bacterium]
MAPREFVFIVFVLVVPFNLQAQEAYNPVYREVGPGQHIVLQGSTYSLAVDFAYDYNSSNKFSQEAASAFELVPNWIKPDLYAVFIRMNEYKQKLMAALLKSLVSEEPHLIDEVAFSLAHLPQEDLDSDNFNPEILVENARNIYQAAELVDFARLIEKEEGNANYYTTVELDLSSESWVTGRDYYYWYVVHPRLGDEPTFHIDPISGEPATVEEGGKFWRSYLLEAEPDPDYRRAFETTYPNYIADLSVYSADYGIMLEDLDPVVAIRNQGGEEPVLFHYTWNRGSVYAATLKLDSTFTPLLENLLMAGFGPGGVLTTYFHEQFLVIREQNSEGATVIEDELIASGYEVTVWDATEFGQLQDATELETFKKIIIPSDQSDQLYALLEAKGDILEAWMDATEHRVFLFLGSVATTSEVDWGTYVLPFNLSKVAFSGNFSGEFEGYPDFNRIIAGDHGAQVWDGQVYPNLSGQRKSSPDDIILDKIGYLTSQNLELNVGELPPEYSGVTGDCPGCIVRSSHPVRIINQHYGNCGELQDVNSALGRLSLIPSAAVGGITEDHVWNEYYLQDQWLPFQVSWSDSNTIIGVPGNKQDKDYGGGKDLAIVYRNRPDGKWENITNRYSNTNTLVFQVNDGAGNPVDGARILLASENYYDPDQLTYAIVVHTDYLGKAQVEVGDYQNIFAQITSPAGSWPEDGVAWIMCAQSSASGPQGAQCPAEASWNENLPMPTGDGSGLIYDVDINLEDSLPAPAVVEIAPGQAQYEPEPVAKFVYSLRPTALQALQLETVGNTYLDNWSEASPPDFYVFDQENLDLFLVGEDATALARLVADGQEHSVVLPLNGQWYIAAHNHSSWNTYSYTQLDVHMEAVEEVDKNPLEPGSSGCNCHIATTSTQSSHLPLIVLVFLGLALIVRRAKLFTSVKIKRF